jgi:hypothetical protein
MALLAGVSTAVLIPARVEHNFSLVELWATMALVTAGVLVLRTAARRVRILVFWYPLLLAAAAAAFLSGLDIFTGHLPVPFAAEGDIAPFH